MKARSPRDPFDRTRLSAAKDEGTPLYVYAEAHILGNIAALKRAFEPLGAHIHYSAKANANLEVLKIIQRAGVGFDAVSEGEIRIARRANFEPHDIVFAGVGKTMKEIAYAVGLGVGWFNVENRLELDYIQHAAEEIDQQVMRVALRLNPDVQANTLDKIATGHGKAKFGLTEDVIADILQHQDNYSKITFDGIHVHIGSQLRDTAGTVAAVRKAITLMKPYPRMRTINIGGGFPVAYTDQDALPPLSAFVDALLPILDGYEVLIEPGRSIVANAGVLLTEVLYIKEQGGTRFAIVDASMTDFIRPALYGATHEIEMVTQRGGKPITTQVVGPVCETTDVLGTDVPLPEDLQVGDILMIRDVGAYGAVMRSQYNARPLAKEIVLYN